MIDERILKFISKQHLASVCVVDEEGLPHSFSAFYALDKVGFNLIIASSDDTKHIRSLSHQNIVSGTISLDTFVVAKIEGVQFKGKMFQTNDELCDLYFKRFFYAKAMRPKLWKIRVDYLKYTNNSLGFGKKIIWQRD